VVVRPADGHSVESSRSPETPVLPAASGPTVVRAESLARRYGETAVLDGVGFELEGGWLHAVTGPSGSGKTTLLHMLAGLALPDAGSIAIEGVELTTLDRTARATLRREKIAYVGQQAGLVPHLSALENVELVLSLRGRDGGPAAAFAALESVGLGERATQRVSRLSQGERARVAIARALVVRPRLLLADEPTSRLDGANAIAVAVLLARLAGETGAAVVCATHDPLVIEQAQSTVSLGSSQG
jgi:putative ABC transport system ATP-binding protein